MRIASIHLKKYTAASGATRWAVVQGETIKSTHATRPGMVYRRVRISDNAERALRQ